MFKKRLIMLVLSLVVLVGVLAACSNGNNQNVGNTNKPTDNPVVNDTDSKGESKQAMNIALSVNLASMDVHFTSAASTRQIGSHVYESLFTYDKDYKVVPMLAKEYSMSEDGLTVTIPIREDVTFHNGNPMKAEDVVASLERWSELSGVAKTVFASVTSLTALNDYTIEFKLSKPSSILIPSLAAPSQPAAIMPKDIVEAAGKEEVKEYIGTGPYKFADWKQDQYALLTKFDEYKAVSGPKSGYAGEKIALIKDLYFRFVTNAPSRIAGLQSGDYDFAEDIPIDNYETLKQDKNLQMHIAKPSRANMLFFNKKEGIFTDINMRKAVNAALDLDSIMLASASNPDFYRIDSGIMFQEQKDWYSGAGNENHNLKDNDLAKEYLKAAGYNGEPVTILSSKEYTFLYNASLVITEQLKAIGVNVDLQVYDWPTLIEHRKNPGDWDIFFTFTTLAPDPTQISFLDSRKEYPGWYNNPQVDQLIDQLAVTTNQDENKVIFDQLQKLYAQDVSTIKLGDMFALSASRDNVKNYEFFYDIHFWNVSLE